MPATVPDGAVKKRIELSYLDGVNSLASWNIAKRQELAHAENVTSPALGVLERRQGYTILGDSLGAVMNLGLFYFPSTNAASTGQYRLTSQGGGTASIFYLNTSNAWITLGGSGASISYTANSLSTAAAEGRLYLVNGEFENRFIDPDGTTVTATSGTYLTNDFYNSPLARKVNYYKGKLYLADVTYGTGPAVQYKNQVHHSSPLLGIMSLIDGDHVSGVSSVAVTDSKYIYSTDSLEVFRGDVYVTTLSVNAKTELAVTLSTPTTVPLLSGDEIWIAGTNKNKSGNTGIRRFRWSSNGSGGLPLKLYDTFQLVGGTNERITMLTNVGGWQMIGNVSTVASWDGANLVTSDTGIGNVSDNGFVKFLGMLYFVSYTGIYATRGSVSPRLMSSPVEPYIKGATKAGLEAAVAGRKGLSLFFHIGTVTLTNPDGSTFKTLTDTVLEYDARQDNWYVHTGIPVSLFSTYISSSDPESLVFASNTGSSKEVFTAFSGELDNSATTIPMRVDFHSLQLCDNFEDVAYPTQIVVYTDRGNSMQCFVCLDDSEQFYELRGQFDKGVGIIPVTNRDSEKNDPPRCHRIRISLRGNNLARTRLSKLAINYYQAREEDEASR